MDWGLPWPEARVMGGARSVAESTATAPPSRAPVAMSAEESSVVAPSEPPKPREPSAPTSAPARTATSPTPASTPLSLAEHPPPRHPSPGSHLRACPQERPAPRDHPQSRHRSPSGSTLPRHRREFHLRSQPCPPAHRPRHWYGCQRRLCRPPRPRSPHCCRPCPKARPRRLVASQNSLRNRTTQV